MWRSLWRSIDRFSLQHFKYLINELQETKIVNKQNRDSVVDILRSIVEIVTFGDRHDPSIFECFMEYQILAEFLRVLKISRNSNIEVPLLHYLSVLIQNLASEHAIYYCFSNEYINNIILHQYKFEAGDLASYFISFLRTVSGKLNRETICLLVKVHEDVVVSFPLYTEALKFARNEEKMIQIAVRALILNVYNASDDMVFTFMTTPPASEYFSDLVLNLSERCLHLDSLVNTTTDTCTLEMRNLLRIKTDEVVNDLFYFNDILRIGQPRLRKLIIQNLLRSLVLPVLLPPVQFNQNVGSHVSSITSLYVICRLLQVVEGRELVNSVAVAVLYFYAFSFVRSNTDKDATGGGKSVNYFAEHLAELKEVSIPAPEPEGAEDINKTNLFCLLSEYISSNAHFDSCLMDNKPIERSGILPLILSENHNLLLASLMFLLILSECKDLDNLLSTVLGFAEKETGMEQEMVSDNLLLRVMDGSIFSRHMPQILTGLLKVLVCQPPLSVLTQWHTGWVLEKLLGYHEMKLTDHDNDLFSSSFKLSNERLLQELNGCWFDYIPVTLEKEWEKCKRALGESALLKDPFVVLEISMHKHLPDGDVSSTRAWQKMVDAVKVFVLHHLLEAFIYKRGSQEDTIQQLRSASMGTLGKDDFVDVHSATYGTQTSLGPGIPCKIAFSKTELRDVYLIPVAQGISGKLLLAEKLPLHTDRGVVIAIAPLAGLSPKKDDIHSTWLHLHVREFNPRVQTRKAGGYDSTGSDHLVAGRWTLAFTTPDNCEAALSLILRETEKQKSSVERLLSPLLEKYSPNNLSDCQGA